MVTVHDTSDLPGHLGHRCWNLTHGKRGKFVSFKKKDSRVLFEVDRNHCGVDLVVMSRR